MSCILGCNINCLLVYNFVKHPPSLAHNIVMGFLLATSSYISLAWYDVLYDCNDKLKPTLFGWMSKGLKPPQYAAEYDKLPLKTKKVDRTFDIIVLLLVALTFAYPFFFYKKR